MNRTQLTTEMQAYSDNINAQYAIARDSLPKTPEMAVWRKELNSAANRLIGRWLYEQVDRLDSTEQAAFFGAFAGGEDGAHKMARENPAEFLAHAVKRAL